MASKDVNEDSPPPRGVKGKSTGVQGNRWGLGNSASSSTSLPQQQSSGVPSATNVGAQQIQALNLLLQTQRIQQMSPESLKLPIQTQKLAKGVVEVGGGRKKRVERVVKPSEEQEEINKMAKEEVQQATSKEVFSTYENRNPVLVNCMPHPADIVEAASLADVPLPPATYSLIESIPESLITSGKLSDLQLEGVLYACQRHLTLLPDGSRAGFFIGDGAGVGKGRQIAGIILDNYARGRCKHIWFSVSHDLRMDAERDLRDIGCHIKVIDGCQQLDKETRVLGLPPDFREGVVFSTYATLVSTVQRGGQARSRLQQLVSWCGGVEFDGCLIFDECHKAKNFIPGNEKRSTKIAMAVTTLQKLLPKARVVYCSATGVSDVKNLAYMERLGLWGEGLAYRSFESFLESITQRGLGAAELLTMEMKSAGVYVSRGLSFRQAEFSTLEVPLSPEQIQIYDTAAHVWHELHKSLALAVARVGASNQRVWASFWGAHQRFFKQLCMSMKVPAIVAEAKRALEAGFSVVIGLQTTGESSLENEITQSDGELSDFVSLTREILQRFIRDHFPTTINSQPMPTQDLWCVTAKDMLLDFVSKMDLPYSPLDGLIEQLGGVECVAEMTGRRGRVVRVGGGRVQYELRDSGGTALESLNNRERTAFMEGRKVVAIISDAASTGISLHADCGAANQRRREHLTMELPWSADKAVQQLGRSHRANQSSGPLYQLVTTNLGGERRFAAAVAKRLQTLGALTKGDRRAATGVEFNEFNFDTQYGRSALRQMYQSIMKRDLYGGVNLRVVSNAAGVTEELQAERFFSILQEGLELMGVLEGGVVREGEVGDVSKFLNRILGLKVHQQNLLFAYFCECVSVIINIAKKEGRFNEGVTDIMAKSIQMVGAPEEVFTEYRLSHVPTIHSHVMVDRGVGWEEASRLAKEAVGASSGFYRSRREQYHRHLYLLALPKENSSHLFNIIRVQASPQTPSVRSIITQFQDQRPNTGRSFYEETKTDLLHKYVPISLEQAEEGWNTQYENTKDRCIHGASCNNAPSCMIGCRLSHLHLLSGGLLPLMSLLETTLTRNTVLLELSREARRLRVVRVQLDDGRRLIGIRYPLPLISEVASTLKAIKRAQLTEHQPLPPSLPMAASDLTVEAETPINKKALARALTPPLTLHSFFKPTTTAGEEKAQDSKEKDSKSKCIESSHRGKQKQGRYPDINRQNEGENKAPVHEPEDHDDATQIGAWSNSPLPPLNKSHSKTRGLQMKLAHSFARLPLPTTCTDPVVIDDRSNDGCSGTSCRELEPGSMGSRRAHKRKSEESAGAPIVKALRQMEKKVVVICPVCSKEFTDITNFDINQHLDCCLSAHKKQTSTTTTT